MRDLNHLKESIYAAAETVTVPVSMTWMFVEPHMRTNRSSLGHTKVI